MELVFINTSQKPICEYHKDDSTPAQDVDSGEIGSVDNRLETDSDMDISDNNKPTDYGEVEIHEMLDVPEETITSEDLDNQSTHQLENAQDSGESDNKDQGMEKTLPPEYQGDPGSIIKDMYNQLDIE